MLGNGSILAKLAAILTEHSRTVRKDGTARTLEERTARRMHAFLSHLALGGGAGSRPGEGNTRRR